MSARVAVNGFGRIGRAVLRIILERPEAPLNVVAVNDLADNELLAYLLRRDSVMGTLDRRITVGEGMMTVGGHHIRMLRERDPARLPWAELGVDVAVESTGAFTARADLEKHLRAGARRVLLTVPAKDEIDATIVLGVNDGDLDASARIVSNASCTTNCLAPLAKVLHDEFGVERGVMTTVHAYTNDQRLADVPHKDFRRSRAATENIIPTTTGAAKAVGKVLPELSGRLDGLAMRVPVPDGSLVDLVAEVSRDTDAEEVNEAVRRAAAGPMSDILEFCEEPLVSSDIIGNAHSSIFDAAVTEVLGGNLVKTVSWYDNEWGYSNRVVDLMERMAALPSPV